MALVGIGDMVESVVGRKIPIVSTDLAREGQGNNGGTGSGNDKGQGTKGGKKNLGHDKGDKTD